MKSPLAFSPANTRHTKARFANPNDYLSYELGQAVQELPPLYTRLLAASVSVLVAGGITWAYYSKVDEVATAPGKLVPSQTLRPVRSIADGIIQSVNVKAGDRVKQDAILLKQDDTIAQADEKRLTSSAKLIKQDIDRLEAERSNQLSVGNDLQNQLISARNSDFAAKRAAAQAEANRQQAIERESQTRLIRLQENLKAAQINVSNSKILLSKSQESLEKARELEKSIRVLAAPENQAVPRLEYIEVQNRVIGAESEVTRSENELVNAQDKATSLQKDIESQRQTIHQAQQAYQAALFQVTQLQSERQSEILTRLNQRREELTSVEGQLGRAETEKALEIIKSPVSGTIYEVKATKGPVQKGEELLSILPDGEEILLEVKVLNRDIGFINPGDRAKVKLTTFPYQEFGTLDGEVIRVNPDATLDEENKELGLVYKTTIKLQKRSMLVKGKPVALMPGMTATADIVTRQKSILTFLLEPITRRFSEAFSVR